MMLNILQGTGRSLQQRSIHPKCQECKTEGPCDIRGCGELLGRQQVVALRSATDGTTCVAPPCQSSQLQATAP